MNATMRFGIFIYPGVEPIDLATFGVLSMARRIAPQIEVTTIAPQAGIVALSNGLEVVAAHGIVDAPQCDVIIVTGGPGWPDQARSEATLAYLRQASSRGRVASVCTGAMILAASGLLDGQRATTKRNVVAPEAAPLGVLRDRYPRIEVIEAGLVDDGQVVTGGGVSLCIDTTLHLIALCLGEAVAQQTARLIEYDRAWAANRRGFPPALGIAPNVSAL